MESQYEVDFVSFLGYINNDTGIRGKGFIFNVISDFGLNVFECILFVHSEVKPFITLPEFEDPNITFESDKLIEKILSKYKLEELLKYEE